MKTNAARILDGLGIHYELREYTVDPDDLSAPSVAAKIGMPVGQVFKTLLTLSSPPVTVSGPREYVFAVIPGDAELDFKKLAHAAGVRSTELAPLKDVQPLTGYVRGGVTLLGAKKSYPAFVDELLELYDVVSVSAGQRGTQLVLSPADYLRATGATIAALTKDLPAGARTS